MDLYKELSEVQDIEESIAAMFDEILDAYHTQPAKAKKLLSELSVIKKEIDSLKISLENLKDK